MLFVGRGVASWPGGHINAMKILVDRVSSTCTRGELSEVPDLKKTILGMGRRVLHGAQGSYRETVGRPRQLLCLGLFFL
ncbi:MAG: hypothetical protein UW63_C0092G0007 [Candidatus Uhrbacteria bacterium GW2011_GWF2_44_350]|uniref:Uncharacterized protein n=1 Tax=Candidatus Uhrbacteria bacterium GW2011_GWF2_44_350 TaxID=1619000 RepID=A0A0G1J8H3_9BACT|nr:MAG: hypothetical protein UW63_C0092G0007 [Candidatus Uhrbacteria bacterium GW2011_GWF2_44_350]